MKQRTAALILALLASAVNAQITPRAYNRTQDVSRASVPDTQPIRWYQGEPVTLGLGMTRAGAAYTSATGNVAAWLWSVDGSDTSYLLATATISGSTAALSAGPTVTGLLTPTNGWTWVELWQSPVGSATNVLGVVWRARLEVLARPAWVTIGPSTNGLLPASLADVSAEAAIRAGADNALGVRIDNITVGPGLGTNDMLAVIASVAPTSRVAYAASAGTAGVALVALGGWPVASVNGQTGNVTVAASLPAGAIVATNSPMAGQSFFGSSGSHLGVVTGYFATAAGSGDMLKSEYDAGGVKQVAFKDELTASTNSVGFTNAVRAAQTNVNLAGYATTAQVALVSNAVVAANSTGATHTAQIATQEAFRVASRVYFSTNSGDAATVGGYTATQLLSQAGVIYYVWGSLVGPFTGVATKMAQLASPYAMGVWTSTVVGVTNIMPLGYVSINTNELPRFTVPGREIAHISVERNGNSQERTMRVCKSIYESNQVTLVSHICGDAKAVPQGKSHLDFDLFETTETAITDTRRYIVYSFTAVSGWGGGETIKVYSQDGELTYISTSGGAGVYASQSSLDAHVTNTDNPHAVTAAQVGALSTNGGRMSAGIFSDVDYIAAAPASDELPTAEWVRSLQSSGKTIYMTTNLYAASWTPTNATVVGSYDTQSATTMVFTVGTAGTYIATMVDTNIVAAGVPLTGPATIHIHLSIAAGSPSANYSLSVKPELYYVYSLTTNQLTLGDFDAEPQTWTSGQSVGKTFALAWTTVTPSVPYYRVYRLKVTAKGSAINTVTMGVGGTDASYATFQTTGEDASAVAADLVTHAALSKHATFAVADIAAAGGMTNNQPITAAQLPEVALTNGGTVAVAATNAQTQVTNHVAQVGTAAHAGMLTNNQTGVTLTIIGGNALTNGAIPGPGCTDLGTAVNLVLSGATVAYVANPTGVYTVSVTKASSAGYVYTLTTFSTNSYTLASGLQLYGSHTIGATNEFVFVPQTNAVYKVRAQKVQ